MAPHRVNARCGTEGAARQTGDRAATQFDAGSGATGVSLDQRPRSAPVWLGFRIVDAVCGSRADRAEIRHSAWCVGSGRIAGKLGLTPQKPLQRAYQRDPAAIEAWQRERFPAIARQAKASGGEVYFWDESGFRADTVHGKTWGKKGQTPVVERPGQRQSISAASAVNARGAFWYCTYHGGLNAELFVTLLRRMMRHRSKPVHLVVDGLPAHKTQLVKTYVAATNGMLTLHFLPGYAPELNPDELVWSHVKRTGVARAPLRRGEKLQEKIEAQLRAIKRMPQLIRSFFKAPSVAYITDL
jgi:transposase